MSFTLRAASGTRWLLEEAMSLRNLWEHAQRRPPSSSGGGTPRRTCLKSLYDSTGSEPSAALCLTANFSKDLTASNWEEAIGMRKEAIGMIRHLTGTMEACGTSIQYHRWMDRYLYQDINHIVIVIDGLTMEWNEVQYLLGELRVQGPEISTESVPWQQQFDLSQSRCNHA